MNLIMILRQLWNQRAANGWILGELVVVTYFLWGVVDPVYVLLSDKALPDNYDLTDTYLLSIGAYSANHTRYNPELDSDSLKQVDFMRIVDQVRRYPGVSDVTVSFFNSYPQSGTWNGGQLFNDTIFANIQQMTFLSGTDYFGVFRIHDARTGEIPPVLAEGEQGIYLTPDVAEKLFGEKYPQNKWIHWGDSTRKSPLSAVIDPLQIRSISQPGPLVFKATSELIHLPGAARICFRVRDGLASPAFTETFKREMRPRMQIGNYYLVSLTDFKTVSKHFEYYMGTTGTIRLQIILAAFFLLCVFLGMGGTFWLRCNSRREEMGIYMTMGSTRHRLIRQFLLEAWWMVTIAFVIGALAQFQIVYLNGFAFAPDDPNPDYIQNRPVLHFLIVSAISYILILAVSFVATYIPVSKAARMNPADALRDE